MVKTTNMGGGTGRKSDRDLKVRVKTSKGRKIGSTIWLQRQLNDPYVAAAKRDGLRSRAAAGISIGQPLPLPLQPLPPRPPRRSPPGSKTAWSAATKMRVKKPSRAMSARPS